MNTKASDSTLEKICLLALKHYLKTFYLLINFTLNFVISAILYPVKMEYQTPQSSDKPVVTMHYYCFKIKLHTHMFKLVIIIIIIISSSSSSSSSSSMYVCMYVMCMYVCYVMCVYVCMYVLMYDFIYVLYVCRG